MADNKFNPKKKVKITPPQTFIAPPPQEFTEEVRKIADEEAKKQIAKYLTQNQTGQNWVGTIAEISDDLTQAQAPDGSIYSATSIGGHPGKFAPFFKIDNSRGVIYVPEADTYFVDSSTRPGYILERRYDGVYIRQTGSLVGSRLPVNIPEEILNGIKQSRLQAYFSANCKHIMVGWWLENEESPYETRAYYTIFEDFKFAVGDEDVPSLTVGDTVASNINLNALADEQAVPPEPGDPDTSNNIWFFWPGDYTGDYAKFTPLISGYYNTSTGSYPDFVCVGLYIWYGTTQSAQSGFIRQYWKLDPKTLAVFTDVKFAFNNKVDGSPILDVVTAWKAVTVGYLDGLDSRDEQDYFFYGSGLVGTQTCYYSQNQRDVKYSYTYDYDYPYIPPGTGAGGRGYMAYTFEDLTDYGTDVFVQLDGTDGAQFITSYVNDPSLPLCCRGYGLTNLVYQHSNNDLCWYFAVTGYLGTQCRLGFWYSDVYEIKFTNYAGAEGNGPDITYPPEPFFPYNVRCCFFTPGYYTNYYWYKYGAAVSSFANAYYFSRAQMFLRDVTNGGSSSPSFVGRLPTIEYDYDTIDTAFRGIGSATSEVYFQHASLYEITRPNIGTDASVQALLDILRESGLGAVADYLEEHPELFGQVAGIPLTNQVYWWCSAYGADPYYGYLQPFDVTTDRIVSPQGAFPFAARYLKGIDSLAVIGYNIYNGNEQVIIFNVAESGETTVGSLSSRKDPGASYPIMDVGMKYGP